MGQETVDELRNELSAARRRIIELEAALYERSRIAEAVRGSEDRYRRLVENAHDVLWVFNLDLGYTYVSPSVKLLRGCTVEEAMTQRLDEVLTPESAKKARELFERELLLEIKGRHHEPEWSYTTDFEMIHKDGHTFWTEMTMNALYDKDGTIRGIMGITRDITDRKKAEDELKKHRTRLEEMVRERTAELTDAVDLLRKEIAERREVEEKLRSSEERFQLYFSLSDDVMFSYDSQFRVDNVTPNVERYLGYKPAEMIGKTFLDLGLLHPDYMNEAIGNALKVLSGKPVLSSVYGFVTRDGETKFGEVSGVPIVRDGKVTGEISVGRDITERISLQKALQLSEERYRTTLETLPDAVGIMSAESFRYIYVNDTFSRLTGYSGAEVIGKTPLELDLPVSLEEWERCTAGLRDNEPVSYRSQKIRTKKGALLDTVLSARAVEYGGKPCVVMIITDITTLKQIEEEKHRIEMKSQKMEAIGTLASGIAHDFNNILTTILGYAKMSMKDFIAAREDDDLSAVRSDLTELRSAAYRARDLVNHILAFSRHSGKDYSSVPLGSSVRESLKLLRPSLPPNIKIVEDIEDSCRVLGDPAQLHLVMANLCTNAAHAMEKTGGTLEVSVCRVPADGVPEDADAPAGPCLKLSVRDTGSGMTPQTMARIFDPYFTTRGKGTGTGLGLSVIHGIVKNHGGSIVCRSLPGEGTTFDIFLPLHEGTAERGEDGDARVLDLDRELPPGGGGQAGKRADGFRTGTP